MMYQNNSNLMISIPLFQKWCFVSKSGLMEPCSCRFKECGCKDESDVVPTPKCDGSSIPKVSIDIKNIFKHVKFDILNYLLNVNFFQSIDACETKYCQTRYNTGPFKHTACRYCGIGRLCGSSICQYGLTDVSKIVLLKHLTEQS